MANLVLAPMSSNARTRKLQERKRLRRENPALYKKDWLTKGKNNVLGVDAAKTAGVEWRGWLYEEGVRTEGKEVGMGWCNKGNHYIAWHLRHGHVEQCQWRGGRLYGK